MMPQLMTIIRLSLRDYMHERLLSICAILGIGCRPGADSGSIWIEKRHYHHLDRSIGPRSPQPRGDTGGQRRLYLRMVFIHGPTPGDGVYHPPDALHRRQLDSGQYRPVPTAHIGCGYYPLRRRGSPAGKVGGAPTDDHAVVLSASAARKLAIAAGQTVIARIGRSVRGRNEQVEIALKVTAVLPQEAIYQDSAFVRLPLLEATEDYRDGFELNPVRLARQTQSGRRTEISQFPVVRPIHSRCGRIAADIERSRHRSVYPCR